MEGEIELEALITLQTLAKLMAVVNKRVKANLGLISIGRELQF